MVDEDEFTKFLRMAPEIFDDLLNLIECDIKKKGTIMRDTKPPNNELAATLTFLSTGAIMLNCNIYFGCIKAQLVNLYQKLVRQFTRD